MKAIITAAGTTAETATAAAVIAVTAAITVIPAAPAAAITVIPAATITAIPAAAITAATAQVRKRIGPEKPAPGLSALTRSRFQPHGMPAFHFQNKKSPKTDRPQSRLM